MPDNFFDRECATLLKLNDAVRERAAAEAELTSTFQTALEKAERDANRARKALTATREHQLGEIEATHAAAVSTITGRFDAEQFTANKSREEQRQQTRERFTAAQQKAEAEFKDRLWSLDSILEGGEKKAKDQLESLKRKAAAGSAEVENLESEADPLLARCRVSRTAVQITGDIGASDEDPIGRMQQALKVCAEGVESLRNLLLPRWANLGGLVLLIGLFGGLGAISFAVIDDLAVAAGITLGIAIVLGTGAFLLLRMLARRQTVRHGKELSERLALASRSSELLDQFAQNEYAAEHARITEKHARKRQETEDYYQPLIAKQRTAYEAEVQRIVAEHTATSESILTRRTLEMEAEASRYRQGREEAATRLEAESNSIDSAFQEKLATLTAARDDAWNRAASVWNAVMAETVELFAAMRDASHRLFPNWDAVSDDHPFSTVVPQGVRFGEFQADLVAIPEGLSTDERLAPPAALTGPVPAFLPFPDRCSLVLKARDDGRAIAVTALQAIMLRFLTGLPPGKVRFTIVDPIGLGENFAAFMHLADHDEKLVTSQIWTDPRLIEQRLIDLKDHIASVIQKYLRNQYKSIEEYNLAAGEVAEPYRVLVIANFPAAFTPEAAKLLISIVNSGPSCGVCTLLSVDTRAAMPRDFVMADLEAASLVLGWREGRFVPKDAALATFPLSLDTAPDPAAIARIVQRIGKASKETLRVEVPFDYIAPKPDAVWHGSASKGFDVPVGRAGATRMQSFALGRGTAQHALIAGKTGSGKSTLLHALITNLALIYSPDEAEVYLIDFKEGVEFQWYATYKLPHARVVAIQSEREFGLSVLQRLDAILRERGEKFRDAGVNDLASFRAATPDQKTPRILLLVDEFQQFFVEDDKLSQEAALLLDRLVRQGRAFGLHVVLGSQTLGGSYSLPRATIDQMAVRVALQCSDADAQLILSKDNTAARLLSRPGEAIYNDANGLMEGNDPFQVVWLSDERREQLLRELHERAGNRYPVPLVFEGNASADVAKNRLLSRTLESPLEVKAPAAWLGDPVAIKDPTAVVFRPAGSANVLMIGQNEEAARGLFTSALVSLASQLLPKREPTFAILDGTPDDAEESEFFRKLLGQVPLAARTVGRADVPAMLAELANEIDQRQKGETSDKPPRFLFVFAVHRFRELRKSDDDFGFGRRGAEREPSPAERFATILRDGPPQGIHVVLWCDSLTNLNRCFDRPQLREFGLRVLFQMSATDSSTLMDTPAASRLGRNRALLLTEETERPEKFRPYGIPSDEWLATVAEALNARIGLNESNAAV